MLRPADGITDRRSFIRTGCCNQRVCDFLKKCWGDAANLFDHLRGVTREMPFEFLKNTLGILQSEIPFGITQSFALVFPAFHLIGAPVFVPAGEITVSFIFRVAVFIAQNAGRIRVVNDVIPEEEFVLDDMMDNTAKKCDVAAGADWYPDIGQRARTRKPWIDMDYGRAVLLSNEGALTRFPDAVRHHLHRTIHGNFRPLFRARCAVFYFRFTLRMREQLIRRRTLWTKIPLADRTFRIAFDGNQFAVFVINELTATDTAIWTDRARNFCVIDPGVHRTRLVRHRLEAGAILALANLPNEWPFRKQRKHNLHPSLRGWNGSQSLENVIVQR